MFTLTLNEILSTNNVSDVRKHTNLGLEESLIEISPGAIIYYSGKYGISYSVTSLTGDRGILLLVSSFPIQMTLANQGISLSGE